MPLKQLNEDGFFPEDTREIGEAFEPGEGKDALGITITRRSIRSNGDLTWDDAPPGFWTQSKMLFEREIKNLIRNPAALGARFGLTIFMSILVGIIFWQVGTTDPTQNLNLQSHFGALIMVMLLSMFGTAQPALLQFPEERPVFLREYSTNHYSVLSYFISRFTMEALVTAIQIWVQVIITYYFIGFQAGFGIFYATVYVLSMASTALAVLLGSAVENPKMAQEMLPILFVPQMLFAGFFVAPELIPVWLRWAQYLCTLTYGVRILLVAEFYNCGNPAETARCNSLVANIGANPDDTWWYWLILMILFVFFRGLALFVLRRKATKFF